MGRRWGRRRSRYDGWGWPRYVPVAERRANAQRQLEKQKKKGETYDPVIMQGRAIARTFWGKAWCDHLESHSDFENRLPRGRSYLRNGSVCDLKIESGRVRAQIAGSELYTVEIGIKRLPGPRWAAIRNACAGGIASAIELLRGRLSNSVMAIITDRTAGLFPRPPEIEMSCSCPDSAVMCKHVAATLYGVGTRLDDRPELLFVLRGVDHRELIGDAVRVGTLAVKETGSGLADSELSDIFGVEIENPPAPKIGAKKANKRGAVKKRGMKPRPATRGATPPLNPLREAPRAKTRGIAPLVKTRGAEMPVKTKAGGKRPKTKIKTTPKPPAGGKSRGAEKETVVVRKADDLKSMRGKKGSRSAGPSTA